MKGLFLIPARGGSKRIPGKNIKDLNGNPLIYYTIDVARQLTDDKFICVSTDDSDIIDKVESYGLKVPFIRPKKLAGDDANSYEVILHAKSFYENNGFDLDFIVLLQPTSPFRKSLHVKEALSLFSKKEDVDMVVSVSKTDFNPSVLLYEEDENGMLQKIKKNNLLEQGKEAPTLYESNGAIYVMKVNSLNKYNSLQEFPNVMKYEMSGIESIDLDTPLDWAFCEFLLEKEHFKYEEKT